MKHLIFAIFLACFVPVGKANPILFPVPCDVPTGLSTTAITTTTATFNWGAVTGAANYRVNWHNVGNPTWQTMLIAAPTTTFSVGNLSSNTQYEWEVKTLCTNGGESAFSAVATFTTLAPPTCVAPTGLSTTAITTNSATFNWDPVSGAGNYRVTWHVAGNPTWQTALVSAASTSYLATGLLASTNYEWKVKSICSNTGESDYSPAEAFTTLAPASCTAPTGLTTTNITANSATFNWTAVSGAANYRVSWHIAGNPTWQTTLVAAPTTSYTATGLASNTQYEWKVKTLCTGGGESDFSPALAFTTLAGASCTAPAGLTTTSITANSATFNWTAVPGAVNYRVNWHIVGNPVWQTALIAAPATSFTATGLAANTQYEWKVKTLCTNGGESDFSPGVTFTTLAAPACAVPSGLSTTNITTNSATFNWGAVAGASKYRVNWHAVGNPVWQTTLVTAPATTFTATGLIPNTQYEWKVKTLCTNGGESDFSPALAFTTLGPPACAVPTGLSTTNITTNSATFNWTAVPGATKYRVNWHVVGSNVTQTALINAPATSFTATGLLPNTQYEWKVKTLCTNGGESDFSPGVTFTTLGPPACSVPTGLSTTNITTNSATFNWGAVAGASNYRVNWHAVGNPVWQTILVAAPATSFTATGLTPNTQYEWNVKTLCTNGGESDFSPAVPFTTLAPPACTAPTGLFTTDITAHSTIFHWGAVAGAANYRVSWHVVGNPTYQTTLVAAPTTSFTATGLLANTQYEWKVKTLCANGGESDFSPGITFTTLVQVVEPGTENLKTHGVEALECWPNPAGQTLEMQYTSATQQTLEVSLISLEGKLVRRINPVSEIGRNRFTFNVSDVANGVYLLEVIGDGSKTVKKVVIQH
jgi:chitodextrinase